MKRLCLLIFVLIILLLAYFFRDTLIDYLPIDQSGWTANEYGNCYLDEKGDFVTGWWEIDGISYCFSPETYALYTGWSTHNDRICYVSHGLPVSGWMDLEGERYYFNEDGSLYTGWLEIDHSRYYLQPDGTLASGWTDTPMGKLFFDDAGSPCNGIVEICSNQYCFQQGVPHSGWFEQDGKRYYFHPDGSMYFGWLEENGSTYYFTEDGSAAMGKVTIDGIPYFFNSLGKQFILVNSWNAIPKDYEPSLVVVDGIYVSDACQTALQDMLHDCRAAGFHPFIMSGYRGYYDQQTSFANLLYQNMRRFSSYESAYLETAQVIAIPGTSEHHLGLALDIVDYSYRKLNERQETMPTQQWLMEHCWDYGFILRYPEGTTDLTGIIYEPWHYRYVGVEMAQEIRDLGVCLEEYVDMLTADGSRCNDGPMVEYELYRP